MTRSRVFKFKSHKFFDFINHNNHLIILTAVFIISLICGCMLFSSSLSELAGKFYKSFIGIRSENDFFKLALSVFWSIIPFQLSAYLCGTSILGAVLVPMTLVARGLYLGLLTAYIYSNLGLQGIAFNGLIIMPAAVLSVLSLIFSAREALKFSLALARRTLNDDRPPILELFRSYSIREVLYLVLLLFAAVIDAVCSLVFIEIF